ncbi:MAG TPA: CU044_2847 family protein [Thermoanaerobaculia bacterium]
MADSIPLIGLVVPVAEDGGDRFGGQEQGFVEGAAARVVKSISPEQFAAQMEQVIGTVRLVAERLKAGVGDYSTDEITIGLAVSAEGSIGVATAGVEASIQVTLKRKDSKG